MEYKNDCKGVCAGIVTYNPDLNRLIENINAVLPQVEKLIIVDNGSSNCMSIKELCTQNKKLFLIKNDTNLGIAKGLNQLFKCSLNNSFSYTLTLDQDSIAPAKLVHSLLTHASEDVAIICPFIKDINLDDVKKPTEQFSMITRCITSGSLTQNKAWKMIHGFDEEMFIDGVDFDFCDRLIKSRYRILQVNEVELLHEIGKIKIKHFFGFPVTVRNHSAFRKYYIAKNIIYLDKKNHTKDYPVRTFLRIGKQIAIVLLFEEDKYRKFKALINGTKAGIKYKFNSW